MRATSSRTAATEMTIGITFDGAFGAEEGEGVVDGDIGVVGIVGA